MKNNIKSIVVGLKPFDLSVGQMVHTCNAFSSGTYIILHAPKTDDQLTKLEVVCIDTRSEFAGWKVGRTITLYLGDLGVPGYAYDDRPCSLFRSELAATAHAGNYWNWLDASKRFDLFSDDYWRFQG